MACGEAGTDRNEEIASMSPYVLTYDITFSYTGPVNCLAAIYFTFSIRLYKILMRTRFAV